MKVSDVDLLIRLCLAAIVAALALPAVVDVDLWGHVMFGRDIAFARAVPTIDHYSFTSDLPWIDHEWLAELVMFGAYAAGSGLGLVILRAALIAGLIALVWYALRQEEVGGRAALTLLTITVLLTYPRAQHVRPQLFSLVAFAGLLVLLKAAERGQLRALFGVPPLMALWANLHGGFLVGLLPIGLWGLCFALDVRRTPRERVISLAVLAASVPATLLNPYGIDLWAFLLRTVGPVRRDITEWLPMPEAEGAVFVFWMVAAVLAGLAMWREGRPRRIQQTALVVLLGFASFRVNRLDAFFVIAIVACLGAPLATVLARRRSETRELGRPLFAGAASVPIVLAFVGYGFVRSHAPALSCIDMNAAAEWLPERAAVEHILERQLRGRMVVYFDWGELALWHFAPGIKVSTDGRRETIYSDRHIQGHLAFYAGTPAGLAYLRELDPDYLWLPKDIPVVSRLGDAGWRVSFSGPRSVILRRGGEGSVSATDAEPVEVSPGIDESPRCFPGP